MKTSKYLIYGLVDPETKQVRYVGKSSSGLARPKEHARPSRTSNCNPHHKNWIQSLRANGLTYEIQVLEEFNDISPLSDAERKWIAHFRSEGNDLTNATDGGDGNWGYRLSEETKRKIGAANAAHLNSPEVRAKSAAARVGLKPSPETVAKLVAVNTGKRRSAEVCQNIGERFRGKSLSEEHRAKLSEAHKGQACSEATRQKMSKQRKGREITEAHRAALSASLQGRVMSQETRDKISAKRLAYFERKRAEAAHASDDAPTQN